MTRISVHRCLFLSLLPAAAWAASGLTAPVSGYAADPAAPEVRTILGLPGALHYGDPLPLPRGCTRVRVAPGRDFAWVERRGAAPAVLNLSGGSGQGLEPVEGAMAAADWVAFSPGAAAAALYSAAAGRLQVLTGLPDAPVVSRDLTAGGTPEQLVAAAVSDDGAILLAASHSAVYLIAPGGAPQMVLSGESILSLAMMPGGRNAVAADGGTGSLYLLQGLVSAPMARTLVSGIAGIGKVQPAWDGASVFVARPGPSAVSIVDVATGATQSYGVDVPPVTLDPLDIHDAFLISSAPGEAGWIFVRNGADARAVFVPAAAQGAAKGSQR